MIRLSAILSGAGDFAATHPFVSAWLALTTAYTLFTVAHRDA
ncbi:hypothetical protein [Phenylobacterium soli]|nr:hypothetical protein [Phenylobacterium soli]